MPGGSTPRVRTRRWGKRRSSSSSSMASSSSSSGRRDGEGWTPRETVGEVDARSWSSPIGDTAVLRSRPSNGAVASAGGRSRGRASSVSPRTGSTPPPCVGDALASGGKISLRWCPPLWPERRRPEVDIPTQTSRRHRGIAYLVVVIIDDDDVARYRSSRTVHVQFAQHPYPSALGRARARREDGGSFAPSAFRGWRPRGGPPDGGHPRHHRR